MSPRDRADQDLAAALRALRARDGRSQEALAHEAGLTAGRGAWEPTDELTDLALPCV